MACVHVLLFNGYADWEIGYVLPELRRIGGLDVAGVGFTNETVVSMGGLRVAPDATLADLNPADSLMLIFPGGYLWEGDYPVADIEDALAKLTGANIPSAFICGATLVAARAGLLRGRKHTSNSPAYLAEKAPGCSDAADYIDSLCVRDRGVITASGLGSVEFAVEVFAELDVATAEERSAWYNAFKHGIIPDGM